jgi:phosphatidylinositol glycan class F
MEKAGKASSAASTPKDTANGSQSQSQLQPTHILSTPTAQAARHALPALQAALFIYRFKDLVADPVPTMWSTLPLVAIIQAAYALLCLPVAGSAKPSRKPRPGEKKKDGSGPNVFVVRATLTLLLSAFGISSNERV